VRELELERDRLQPIAGKVDEEEEAEIVAQLAVDARKLQGVTCAARSACAARASAASSDLIGSAS